VTFLDAFNNVSKLKKKKKKKKEEEENSNAY